MQILLVQILRVALYVALVKHESLHSFTQVALTLRSNRKPFFNRYEYTCVASPYIFSFV